MDNNVQLKSIDMFLYFINHFKMTPQQAYNEMLNNGQDVREVIKVCFDNNINLEYVIVPSPNDFFEED